jgi:hypothetical protein
MSRMTLFETSMSISEEPIIEEEFVDPYADMLNFNAPVSAELSSIILAEGTIMDPPFKETEPIDIEAEKRKKRFEWIHWNEFLERELGDMKAPLLPGEEWLGECRDTVEQLRGEGFGKGLGGVWEGFGVRVRGVGVRVRGVGGMGQGTGDRGQGTGDLYM